MSKPDQLTYPTASALRDCLREQAADSVFGPVVSAAVRYGAAGAATMEGCDCDGVDEQGRPARGSAFVRVASVAPADISGRGQQRAGAVRVTRCASPWLITYELGLMRCYPTTNDGRPLPAADVDQQAQQFLSDQAAIMRAINCCGYLERHSGVEFVRLDAVGPSGGCAGAVATIRVVQARG